MTKKVPKKILRIERHFFVNLRKKLFLAAHAAPPPIFLDRRGPRPPHPNRARGPPRPQKLPPPPPPRFFSARGPAAAAARNCPARRRRHNNVGAQLYSLPYQESTGHRLA